MDAQELQKLNIAGIYHASTGQTLREQDVPEVTKFAEAVIKAWVERAVSPAESVQSVDTPAFRELLLKMYKRTSFSSAILNAEAKAVIAHVDIKIAAAHAEGRRSAMEELHPQWLKEKDRADRAEHNLEQVNLAYQFERQRAETAEAALTANRAGREYVALSDKELSDPEYMRAYVEGCQESFADLLAARQAPDLLRLKRYDLRDAITREEDGLPELLNGDYVRFADVQALLAQPLQQEGGKIRGYLTPGNEWMEFHSTLEAAQAACDEYNLYWRSQPEFDSEDERVPEAVYCGPQPDNLQQASTAQPDQRSSSLGEKVDELLAYLDGLHISSPIVENVREALDKPVASTAQAEPAKMECQTCGVDRFKVPCPNMADECPMVADAHLLKPAKECGNCFEGKSDMDHACRACGGTGVATTAAKEAASATDAADMEKLLQDLANWRGSALVGGKLMHFVSQATPEGADLPQIDYVSERVAFEAAQKYTGIDLTREGHGEYVSYHTHCAWGGWQDRARLAATTAVEPVYQIRDAWEEMETIWRDVDQAQYDARMPSLRRVLYRAAPPQQGMTAIAEMKRSVAGGPLYLQTLIPPHMIPEGTKLYRVDGDTGGLPG